MEENKNQMIFLIIIGIATLLVAIVGATFAWLTFSVNVENGIYNAGTKEFIVNYERGTDIGSVPTLTTATASTASSLNVSAYRNAATSADGILHLKLTTTSSGVLTESGIVKYAVCSGTSTAASCNVLADGEENVLATGAITATGEAGYTVADTNEVAIHHVNTIPTEITYYWIFFWVDAAGLTTEIVTAENEADRTYSGYIHASAVQR